MTARLSRRSFLGASAAAVGAAAVAAGWWRVATSGTSGADAGLRFFADPAAARRVGEAHLELAPEDADADLLSEVLGVRDGALDHEVIRGQVIAEFDHDDVVVVDGWYLARTEARLCALVALNAS